MINHLIAAEADRSLLKKLHYYQSQTFLVVDERWYPSFGREGSDFFFLASTVRHQNRPRILTTNPPSADWGKIFDSTTASTAIADRLVQRSEILILEGTSYRGKQKLIDLNYNFPDCCGRRFAPVASLGSPENGKYSLSCFQEDGTNLTLDVC